MHIRLGDRVGDRRHLNATFEVARRVSAALSAAAGLRAAPRVHVHSETSARRPDADGQFAEFGDALRVVGGGGGGSGGAGGARAGGADDGCGASGPTGFEAAARLDTAERPAAGPPFRVHLSLNADPVQARRARCCPPPAAPSLPPLLDSRCRSCVNVIWASFLC